MSEASRDDGSVSADGQAVGGRRTGHDPASEQTPIPGRDPSLPTADDEALIRRLATCYHLLVATDFDGVLAPIVDDPERSRPLPASVDALARLGACPETSVAIVSGRERRQLQAMVPGAERFVLVGSHGAEIDEAEPDGESRALLGRLTAELEALADRYSGFFVEVKALSVAAHFRRVEEVDRSEAVEAVGRLQQDWPAKVVSGKQVVEFTVTSANKGDAIRALSRRAGASVAVYLGDDITDEDAFAVLGPDDVGIKVGPGPTGASWRLESPEAVAGFLRHLADGRSRHRT